MRCYVVLFEKNRWYSGVFNATMQSGCRGVGRDHLYCIYILIRIYIYIYTDGCMYVIWLVVWNIVYLPIYWEQWYQLTNIVQRGWNHQRVMLCCVMLCCVVLCCVVLCSVSYAMQCNLMSCHVMQCKYVCNVM